MRRDLRISEILFGFFLVVAGLGSLFEGLPIGVVLLILGAYLVGRRFRETGQLSSRFDEFVHGVNLPNPFKTQASEPTRSQRRASGLPLTTPDKPPSITDEWRRQTGPRALDDLSDSASRSFKHAQAAMRAAGHNPQTARVQTVDIGLMAFKGDQPPVLHRTFAIPDDVDYIQPYIVLRLPTPAEGRVRFEIADSDGQTLFIHEDLHDLEPGRTLISPSARLPIHDARNLSTAWTLRVSADGVPLAMHTFEWEEDHHRTLRRHVGVDGEMSGEIRVLLAQSRLQPMSLDELLAPQDDDEVTRKQVRR